MASIMTTTMLVDALLHNEVEGQVDRLVEEVEELAIKVAEEVAEQLQGLLPTIVAQVGDHISNQGINRSRKTTPPMIDSMKMLGMLTRATVEVGVHTRSLGMQAEGV
ncbi:hypothetical protein Tco_1444658 [Tanacetum coccineum]